MTKHNYKAGQRVQIINADGIVGYKGFLKNNDIGIIHELIDQGGLWAYFGPIYVCIGAGELWCVRPYNTPKLDELTPKAEEELKQASIEVQTYLERVPDAAELGLPVPEPIPDDPVKPDHYHHGGIDVFAYGEANFSKEAVAGFYRMNIIKYVTRYDKKGGIQDIEKAEEYLQALLKLERGSDDK